MSFCPQMYGVLEWELPNTNCLARDHEVGRVETPATSDEPIQYWKENVLKEMGRVGILEKE